MNLWRNAGKFPNGVVDTGLIAPGPNFGMESCVVRVNSTTLAFANSEGLKGGGGSLNRGRMTVRLSNTDGEDWLPGVVVDAGMFAAQLPGLIASARQT